MRETLKLSLLLAAIAGLCGALLVAVSAKTEPARKTADERKRLAAVESVIGKGGASRRIVPAGENAFAVFEGEGANAAFAGAAIVGMSAHGYGGHVSLMVGFDAAGNVIDFAVIESHETPGLGAKIAGDAFRSGFRGRPAGGAWKLRKDGGDIDAVTSATISSRAAAEAVADAASRFGIINTSISNTTNTTGNQP